MRERTFHGCGWVVAALLLAWLFILGALVPWITEQVQGLF